MPEYYTHEVKISLEGGSLAIPFSAAFFGEGYWQKGVEGMWKTLFPMATEIVVREIENGTLP